MLGKPGGVWYFALMPRLARVVIPGVPHHAVQWGNNREDVFFVDDDRNTYLPGARSDPMIGDGGSHSSVTRA